MTKEILMYHRQLEKNLDCPKSMRDQFLADAGRMTDDFLAENPGATLDELKRAIGEPDQLAAMFLERADNAVVEKYRKKKIWVKRLAVGLLAVAFLAVTVFSIYASNFRRNYQLTKESTIFRYGTNDTAAPVIVLSEDVSPSPDLLFPFELPLSDSVAVLQEPPPLVTTWEGFLYINPDHELLAAGIVPYYQLRFDRLRYPNNSLTEQIVVEQDVYSVSLSSMSSCHSLMYTTRDGQLWEYGSLTSKTSGNEAWHIMDDVHAVAVGYNHALALRIDGTLWGWGYFNGERTDTPVKLAEDVTAATDISFLESDGTLWALCEHSDTNDGPGLAGVTPQKLLDNVVFASRTSAVQSDGTVWYWEENVSPVPQKIFAGAVACGQDYVITTDNNLIYWPEGFGSNLTVEITDDAIYAVKTSDSSTGSLKDAFAVINKEGELVICYT